MHANRFDRIARILSRTGPRRGVLAILASLPLTGGLVGLRDPDETAEARKRRQKAPERGKAAAEKKRKKKKCKTLAQVCAGKCGPVTYKCKKKNRTADCGSCACNPECGPCHICQGEPGACVQSPVGTECGNPGQFCQADGACACDADSCGEFTPICDGESCVACSPQHPCSEGCCAGNGSCQDDEFNNFFCGPDGGVCVECIGADEICIEGACTVPACGEFGGPCLVFVTSESFNGNLEGVGGLGAANGICQRLADDADLPGTYKAWLSTQLTNPGNLFMRAPGPYRRVDGVKVADSYHDLTTAKAGGQYLSAPINVTQIGGIVSGHAAWTYTLPSGQSGSSLPGEAHCSNWTSGAFEVAGGFGNVNNSTVDAGWTDGGAARCNNFNLSPFRLYCFQQS
jgi:hypothetical protein